MRRQMLAVWGLCLALALSLGTTPPARQAPPVAPAPLSPSAPAPPPAPATPPPAQEAGLPPVKASAPLRHEDPGKVPAGVSEWMKRYVQVPIGVARNFGDRTYVLISAAGVCPGIPGVYPDLHARHRPARPG